MIKEYITRIVNDILSAKLKSGELHIVKDLQKCVDDGNKKTLETLYNINKLYQPEQIKFLEQVHFHNANAITEIKKNLADQGEQIAGIIKTIDIITALEQLLNGLTKPKNEEST
jgi:hypothetical protein